MGTLKCKVCGKSPADGVTTLHRQNPKGEDGIWCCTEHNKKPVDKLVQKIVDALQPKLNT